LQSEKKKIEAREYKNPEIIDAYIPRGGKLNYREKIGKIGKEAKILKLIGKE